MLNTSFSFALTPLSGSLSGVALQPGRPAPSPSSVGSPLPSQEFHLVISSTSARPPRGSGSSPAPLGSPPLPLPSVPCRLDRVSGPDSVPGPASGPGAVPLAVLEPVRSSRFQLRLLVVRSPDSSLCLNGLPAPRVAVAKERDFLAWDDQAAFHLAIYHRPYVGPPPPGLLGKECPVCRVPFTPESKCFVCPSCDTGLHCENDREGGLECVLLDRPSRCPSCGRDVVLKPGYGYPRGDLDV